MASRLMTLADVFGADLSAFWDASDSSTITQSAGAVSQFVDKSVSTGARTGTAIQLTQSTASKQPIYSATGINGFPALIGNGSQLLSGSSTNLPLGSAPATSFILFQTSNNTNTNQCALTWGGPQDRNERILGANNGGPGPWGTGLIQGYNTHGPTTMLNRPSLIVATDTGGATTAKLHQDGTLADTQTTSQSMSTTDGGVRLFSFVNPYCANLPGAIGCAGVIRRVATQQEIDKLYGIIYWQWGLQGNLPANHPYKAAAPTVTTADPVTARRRPLILMAS